MKDFFSSFDRLATSFATGCLFLVGIYLIISAAVPYTYDTINKLMEGQASSLIFSLPIIVLTYVLGVINTTLGTLAYEKLYGAIYDEYFILDAIEARLRPALLKEVTDLINAQRLILGSPVALLLIGIGLIGMNVVPFSGTARFIGYWPINALGATAFFVASLSCPVIAKLIQDHIAGIFKAIRIKDEHPESPKT